MGRSFEPKLGCWPPRGRDQPPLPPAWRSSADLSMKRPLLFGSTFAHGWIFFAFSTPRLRSSEFSRHFVLFALDRPHDDDLPGSWFGRKRWRQANHWERLGLQNSGLRLRGRRFRLVAPEQVAIGDLRVGRHRNL